MVAADVNATVRPSALMVGWLLPPLPAVPPVSCDTSVVVLVCVSRRNICVPLPPGVGANAAPDVNATNLPVSRLMAGSVLVPLCAVPVLSTETRSVLGWMANSTEPVAVIPVLSVTVNVAVKLPAVIGVPLTTPVTEMMDKLAGKTLPISVQVNGAVPPDAVRVEV